MIPQPQGSSCRKGITIAEEISRCPPPCIRCMRIRRIMLQVFALDVWTSRRPDWPQFMQATGGLELLQNNSDEPVEKWRDLLYMQQTMFFIFFFWCSHSGSSSRVALSFCRFYPLDLSVIICAAQTSGDPREPAACRIDGSANHPWPPSRKKRINEPRHPMRYTHEEFKAAIFLKWSLPDAPGDTLVNASDKVVHRYIVKFVTSGHLLSLKRETCFDSVTDIDFNFSRVVTIKLQYNSYQERLRIVFRKRSARVC